MINFFLNIYKRILGFSFVGLIVTLVSVFLLYVFTDIFRFNIYVAYILSYILSISLSYTLNYLFVFKTKSFYFRKMLLYFLVYIFSMIIGLLLLPLFSLLFSSCSDFFISLMCLPFTFTFNFFFANKLLK